MGITKEHLERIEKQAKVMESFGDAAVDISSELDAIIQDNYQMELQIEFLLETNGRLRKQLDSDAYMKLPLDADGEPIRLGDTVWYIGVDVDIEKDCPMEVNGFVRVPFVLETFIETVECPRKAIASESLTHKRLEPPDSWEKLENDAKKTTCDYASAPCDEYGLTTCDGCRFQKGGLCHIKKTIDVVERAKKLAGIEEEARND